MSDEYIERLAAIEAKVDESIELRELVGVLKYQLKFSRDDSQRAWRKVVELKSELADKGATNEHE